MHLRSSEDFIPAHRAAAISEEHNILRLATWCWAGHIFGEIPNRVLEGENTLLLKTRVYQCECLKLIISLPCKCILYSHSSRTVFCLLGMHYMWELRIHTHIPTKKEVPHDKQMGRKNGVIPYTSTILLHDKQMGREEGVTPYSITILPQDMQMGREEGVTPYSITILLHDKQMVREDGVTPYSITILLYDKQMGREEGVTPYSSTILLYDKWVGRRGLLLIVVQYYFMISKW